MTCLFSQGDTAETPSHGKGLVTHVEPGPNNTHIVYVQIKGFSRPAPFHDCELRKVFSKEAVDALK